MAQFKNALQVFTLLNKSNCRDCMLPTCLAFAGAVYTGQKKLGDCPHLPPDILRQYGEHSRGEMAARENVEQALARFKAKVPHVSLEKAAENLGGTFGDNKLTIQVLGKKLSIDQQGEIYSDLHTIPWLTIPVYDYVTRGGSEQVRGEWVPLRELQGGQDWYRLFGQRCEKPLKKLADSNPELFGDLVRLFSGKEVAPHYSSDVSVVLHPLPRVPMLICYWLADGELDSDLNLFFDASATDYLELNSLNSLGSGFVTMLEKLSLHHGLRM